MILDYLFLTVLLTLERDLKKLFDIKNREKQEKNPSRIALFWVQSKKKSICDIWPSSNFVENKVPSYLAHPRKKI